MTPELSIVMPCLDEARTVGRCVSTARAFLDSNHVAGEVIVADNGSSDGSRDIAEAAGARVVSVPRRGYGEALRAGIASARGRYVIMCDSDESYDLSALGPLLDRLRAGDDLVVGNRFRGKIEAGAMPFLHRYMGNPGLSLLARVFFGSPIGDVYCGLRGFSKEAARRLDLRSAGMEFALEMIVKATLLKLRISEVPVTLRPDGRGRPPHLHTWRDGRRSLLLYLASMPNGLFLYPGLAMILVGLALGTFLVFGPVQVGSVHFDIHTLLYCAGAVTIGFQLVTYSLFLRFLMVGERLLPPDPIFTGRMSAVKLEVGLLIGGGLTLGGLAVSLQLVGLWRERHFADLDPFAVMRFAIPATTALVLGLQVIAAALFLSLLKWQLRTRLSG